MNWTESFFAALLGGGAVATFVWATARKSIDRAIDLAAERKMESLKAQFAKELERERQLAALALERFKSELSLPAELRRQVAAKKLAALLDLVAEGEPLMRTPLKAVRTDTLNSYLDRVRAVSIYVEKPVADALAGYIAGIANAREQSDERAVHEVLRNYERFLDLIRNELGISIVGGRVSSLPEVGADKS